MKPEQYKYIAAWGIYMGSFLYYIKDQQKKAASEDAPIDSIYCNDYGTWVRCCDIENDVTRRLIEELIKPRS